MAPHTPVQNNILIIMLLEELRPEEKTKIMKETSTAKISDDVRIQRISPPTSILLHTSHDNINLSAFTEQSSCRE
jgi:hypothetical protein